MSTMQSVISLALSALALVLGQSQRAADVIVPSDHGRNLEVASKLLDGVSVQTEVLRLARASAVAVGLERVTDPPRPRDLRPNQNNQVRTVLSGKTVGSALDVILSAARRPYGADVSPTYSWTESNGLIHVSSLGARKTFLDTVVPVFEATKVSVARALRMTHRLFDSDYPLDAKTAAGAGMDTSSNAVMTPLPASEGSITVSLKNASVRTVLDEIAKSAGPGTSWVVVYQSESGQYGETQIGLVRPDGSSLLTRGRSK